MKMRGMKKKLFFASFRMKAASGPCGRGGKYYDTIYYGFCTIIIKQGSLS